MMERLLKLLVVLAAFAGLMVGCAPYWKQSGRQSDPHEMTRKAFVEAKEKNLGIIVMPTFRADDIYKWNQKAYENHNVLLVLNETKMIWKNKDSTDNVFIVATRNGLEIEDPGLSLISLSANDRLYQVFIVEPGTYDLIGSKTAEQNKTLSPTGTTPVVNAKTIGQSFVTTENMNNYRSEVAWHNAQYTQSTQSSWSCTLQHVSGACVSGVENRYNVDVMTRPAGYSEDLQADVKPGLIYTSLLSKPFATVEVKAGEVILADSFFAVGKNVNFQDKSCVPDDGSIRCSINSFDAAIIRTSLKQFKNDVIKMGLSDKKIDKSVLDTLNQAKYSPLRTSAKVDRKKSSRIGEVYTLR